MNNTVTTINSKQWSNNAFVFFLLESFIDDFHILLTHKLSKYMREYKKLNDFK